MSWILLFVLVFVVLAILAVLKSKQSGGIGIIGFPYLPAKTLFTPAERSFLGVLDQAVSPEHRVFGKIRVADVALVRPGLGNSAQQAARNRISQKHFDFIVCRASDLAIVCAVELNDKSHSSKKAQARDDLLANVCRVINLPLLTVPAKAAYSPQDLRTQFLAAVEPVPAGVRVGT